MSIQRKIILASASPRRAEILRNAGFEFEVIPAEISESVRAGESPEDYVQRLAKEKADRVAVKLRARPRSDKGVIVAADTTVSIGGEILGKPESAQDARRILQLLSGKWHEVFTGLAVMVNHSLERQAVAAERTRVKFAVLSEQEIEDYIATGEPFGKAGAYAIQGRGGRFIRRIEGCYFNVMGLPLARLNAILKELDAI